MMSQQVLQEVKAIIDVSKQSLETARNSLRDNQIPGLQQRQAYESRDAVQEMVNELNQMIAHLQSISDSYLEINNA